MASASIDDYISPYPSETQKILKKVRSLAKEIAPDAEEGMSYGVPAFKLNGVIFNFAAFKSHLGIYPTPSAIEAFEERLQDYETAKGTIKFPFDKEIPYELIKEIIAFRVEEQRKK